MLDASGRNWIARWIAFVQRSPRSTLAISIVVAVASLLYSSFALKFRTQRTDLLDRDHPVIADYTRFCNEFDHEADMIVVAEGDRRDRLISAVEMVAAELRRQPKLFKKLLYRLDTNRLRTKGLYQLSTPILAAVETRLEPLRPLLMLGSATWQALTLNSALFDLRLQLATVRFEAPLDSVARQKIHGTIALLGSLADFAASADPKYKSPWGSTDANDVALPSGLESIPDYILSPNGRLAVLRVLPVRDPSTFVGVGGPVSELRNIVERVGKAMPDVNLGLTGLPILEDDEMQTAMSSSVWE
jgi:hypothetical protein